MAIKKRNKKSNKKHNNNKYNNNIRKNSAQNGQQVNDSSIDYKTNTDPTAGNSHNDKVVDIFGDSDQRLDLKTVVDSHPVLTDANGHSSKEKHNFLANYSPKGLTNSGNTCYFNSVLQIISETHLLFDLLNERSNDGFVYRAKSLMDINQWSADQPFDEELEISLGQCQPLTQSLISFMREMRSTNSRTITPNKLLRDVRKEWTQFEGWAQQDSHELLRCLLDSLKCKEVLRQKKAILNQFKTVNNTDVHNMDDDTKARIKSFATHLHSTPIDSVFGGQLLSSVCCDVCKHSNLIFEPFFDLSLPLSHLNQRVNNNCVIVEKNGSKFNGKKTTGGTTDDKPEVEDLIDEDTKNLTPKQRKQKRMQKKAAKREAKQQIKSSKQIEIPLNPDLNDNKEEVINTEETIETQISDAIESVVNGSTDEFDGQPLTEEELAFINCSESEECCIEPLLGDFPEILTISQTTDGDIVANEEAIPSVDWTITEEQCNDSSDNENSFGINQLFDSNDEDIGVNDNMSTNVTTGWNGSDDEWNNEGYCFPPNEDIKPFFGPELPSNSDENNERIEELASDDCKAEELDLETELLMLSISDREKQLKQSITDSQQTVNTFDPNCAKMKRIIDKCLQTISGSLRENSPKFDLIRLLTNFTAIESLSGSNGYLCEMCNKANESKQKLFTDASKRALIAVPPPVLTLHLKRFEAEGNRRAVNLKKISTFVSFPAVFDLSPFVTKMYNYLQPITGQPKSEAIIYSLYGVVEHTGSLRSGHYTAYVKVRPKNRNLKKFTILEPFMPKMETILKMIELKYFTDNDQSVNTSDDNHYQNGLPNTATNGLANGYHTLNGTEANGQSSDELEDNNSDSGKWYHISDSSVMSSSLSSVLRSQAYILFYERIV